MLNITKQTQSPARSFHATKGPYRTAKLNLHRINQLQTVDDSPLVIQQSVFQVQLCIPSEWSDEKIIGFCTQEVPPGTEGGWKISSNRGQCENNKNKIHVVLGL